MTFWLVKEMFRIGDLVCVSAELHLYSGVDLQAGDEGELSVGKASYGILPRHLLSI